MERYYGKAIRSHTIEAQNNNNKEAAVANMKQAVMAVLYHSVKMKNAKQRHKYCPVGDSTWCPYRKHGRMQNKHYHLDPVFLGLLKPVFERLSEENLLYRCLPGYSQNQNESLNALVWNRCPKHKSRGKKSIEIASASAVLQFNIGKTSQHIVMKNLGVHPGTYTLEESISKDKQRIQHSKLKAKEATKKIRKQLKLDRLVDESHKKNTEGITYEAGGF